MDLLQCYLIALAGLTIGAAGGVIVTGLLVRRYLRLCVNQRCLVMDDVEYTLDDTDYRAYRRLEEKGAGDNG